MSLRKASPIGRILLEYWEGIAGSNIFDLTKTTNYPNKPTGRNYPISFEGISQWGDNYGTRIRGYLYPPATGSYIFWIASDGGSELWLSSDSNLANKQLIASVTSGWTYQYEWTKYASQQSAPITLTTGQKYYVEALHKESTGGDHVAVGWQLPDGKFERPIPQYRYSFFRTGDTIPLRADILKTLSAGHPRLLASAQGFAQLKKQVTENPELINWFQTIRQNAIKLLSQPVATYTFTNGHLLETSRRVVDKIYTLSLAYKLDGEPQYASRAWQELQAVANFSDWNPKHFLDTAEMTSACAIGYDWLYEFLTVDQRTVVRNAILNKGLKEALAAYNGTSSYAMWWVKARTNWGTVCHGGIGMGALAIGDEEPTIAGDVIYQGLGFLRDYAYTPFAPEGGYNEGPAYWDYALTYLATYLAALETAQGSDFGLSDLPGISETGLFSTYIKGATGKAFNYGDGDDTLKTSANMFWLSRRFNRPLYSWQHRKEGTASPLGVFWYDPRSESSNVAVLPLDKYYSQLEVSSHRSAWENYNALSIGFKAGDNKASHGHLDIGSFVLDALGQRWVPDLGADSYALPGYFDSQRWTYYRCRAEGHNTLVINPDSAADQIPTAVAKIIRFTTNTQRAFSIADMTPAYAQKAQKVWRGIGLFENRTRVIVQDEITSSTPAKVWWFMHTSVTPTLSSDGLSATLASSTVSGRLWVRILSPTGATFKVMAASPLPTSPNPSGQNPNVEYRKLAIELSDVTNVQISVLLLPLSAQENPPSTLPTVIPLADWL